ncbi:DUF1932 domain-containing protein [Klebsiella oxytoca]|uniref:NAD(P)-dependent oxidoreductase n=1 Tax=Klebsiella oxytoca TaxID=571 RepID=UPI00357108CA
MINISIIGFGEAGRIYAEDLAKQSTSIKVWDKKFLTKDSKRMRTIADEMNVEVAPDIESAIKGSSLVLSLVTASNALPLAKEIAPLLEENQILLDFNSVSPGTKRDAATAILKGNGRYVDVAVMAPVPPKRLSTPLLLGGEDAKDVAQWLSSIGCKATAMSKMVGDVSAIKMCRSVMIKGIEALTVECLSAAQQYGVQKDVLSSLHASFPSLGWDAEQPDYLVSRVAEHGTRRAEEMLEVVKTLNDVGISGEMSKAVSIIQAALPASLAQQQIVYSDLIPFSWESTLLMARKTEDSSK